MADIAKPKLSRSKRKKFKSPSEGVQEFWNEQAKEHGSSSLATMPDHYLRDIEIESILRILGTIDHETILDVGCGNGYGTLKIAKRFPEAMITGIDFSQAMIEESKKVIVPNTEFFEGDVLSLSRSKHLIGQKFDAVVSTRCLINLANWEEQKVGILEMRKMLKPDGRLILVENVQEGMDNLNDIRSKFGLDPIKVRWHNKYLPQTEVRKFFGELQGHLLTSEYVENIGNFYYMASRVIYAKLCKDQGVEPDYNHPINEIASKMPTMGEYYACSPAFIFVLKNESGNGQARN